MSKSRYQIPEGTDLVTLSPKLRKSYTRSKPNQQRLDFFSLYEYLEKNNLPDEQKVNLLIFEFELIDQNYKTVSPEESKGWIYNTGSQVYTELHKCVGEISVEERLIRINAFRRYALDHLPFEAVKSETWPCIEKLNANIDEVVRKIVQVKEKARINKLLHTMPDLVALKNNIKGIYDGYTTAISSRNFENNKRTSSLAFIGFISTTSDELYGTAYRDKSREENEKDAAYMEAYNVHRGMILYSLLQIRDEYRVLSPNRSALFRECLAAAGYTNIEEITVDERIDWLRSLSKHLDEVRRIKTRLKGDANKNGYEELIEQWKDRKLPDLNIMKHDIEDRIFALEEKKKQPSFVVGTAKSATSSVAAYAFQRVALGYITEYALIPAATASIAGIAAGPVGMVIGGFVGPFIANRIGRLVTEKIIPTAFGNLCVTLLDRIGSAMGDAAAAAAFALFSVSANGFQRLLGFYKEHIGDNFDKDWALTLLELPDDMVAVLDKQKIRKIYGLPEPVTNLPVGKMPKSTLFAPINLYDDYEVETNKSQVAPRK